jgi:hypothetical protein
MKSFITACGGALLAAALATPAAAQTAGTYNGTSADGSGLSFVVGTDSGTGKPAVTNATIFFTAPCKGSSYVLGTGWGFGLTADINKGKVKYTAIDNYFVISFDLVFSGDTATGTIKSISPTLTPVSAKPKKALICTSPTQSLSVSLQTDSARVSPVVKGPVQLYR